MIKWLVAQLDAWYFRGAGVNLSQIWQSDFPLKWKSDVILHPVSYLCDMGKRATLVYRCRSKLSNCELFVKAQKNLTHFLQLAKLILNGARPRPIPAPTHFYFSMFPFLFRSLADGIPEFSRINECGRLFLIFWNVPRNTARFYKTALFWKEFTTLQDHI